MVFHKHDFGNGRYVTLMVVKLPNGMDCSLFGTELQPPKMELLCESMEDGCLIADGKFRQLFPKHSCRPSCITNWQGFPFKEQTTDIQ